MINQLTFTRFIAAFMIVFLHFGGKLFRFDNVFFETIRGHQYIEIPLKKFIRNL